MVRYFCVINTVISASAAHGTNSDSRAGKSSLTLCLLRTGEYVGEVWIDGVDIGKIGLTDLRSNIAIKPQELILFSGTVREALDSFAKYDDARFWGTPFGARVESRPPQTEPPHRGLGRRLNLNHCHRAIE
ncbi:hypothetical protein R3P38DRAFT_3200552 [Favolaschia claudopus]|uniref:Uncharacterized protein n=1 Tax=Favolaschia claudopus TaxID=2862362 RepID=A0AAW0AXW9_9AGAR